MNRLPMRMTPYPCPSGHCKRWLLALPAKQQLVLLDGTHGILARYGSGQEGDKDGPAEQAELNTPSAVVVLADDFYLLDQRGQKLKRVDAVENRLETQLCFPLSWGSAEDLSTDGVGGILISFPEQKSIMQWQPGGALQSWVALPFGPTTLQPWQGGWLVVDGQQGELWGLSCQRERMKLTNGKEKIVQIATMGGQLWASDIDGGLSVAALPTVLSAGMLLELQEYTSHLLDSEGLFCGLPLVVEGLGSSVESGLLLAVTGQVGLFSVHLALGDVTRWQFML
uniref:Uncharacterized protein n=1 Tax=Magnetococcus massalia (strain MO-1) TaxID=451514 RepID=A0A1S7LF40_MAGMO|nr:protein of unknown function [Candidatus Magnetococcus massalia]